MEGAVRHDAERRERDLLATAKLLVSMDVDGVVCQPA